MNIRIIPPPSGQGAHCQRSLNFNAGQNDLFEGMERIDGISIHFNFHSFVIVARWYNSELDHPCTRYQIIVLLFFFSPPPKLSLAKQQQFLKMITHAQSGRMDEQRCTLPQSKSTPTTPTRSPNKAPAGNQNKSPHGGRQVYCLALRWESSVQVQTWTRSSAWWPAVRLAGWTTRESLCPPYRG